jgi:hypothetical protein
MPKVYRCKSRDGKRDVLIEDTKPNAHRLQILRDAGYIITDATPAPAKEKAEKKPDPVKEIQGKEAPAPAKEKAEKKPDPVKEIQGKEAPAPAKEKAEKPEPKAEVKLEGETLVLVLGKTSRELATVPNEELDAFCAENGIEPGNDPLVAIETWVKADKA